MSTPGRATLTHDGTPLSTIRDIEREVVEHANRGWWSRLFHAKYDREKVQGWKLDFQKTLGVFNVRCTTGFACQLAVSEGPSRQH